MATLSSGASDSAASVVFPHDEPNSKRERTDQGTSGALSPPPKSRPDKEAGFKSPGKPAVKALTLALEQCFHFTLRAGCDASLAFLDSSSADGNLDSSNISEYICSHITTTAQVTACGYLISCFRRLHQKEVTAAEAIRPELTR